MTCPLKAALWWLRYFAEVSKDNNWVCTLRNKAVFPFKDTGTRGLQT